MVEKQSSLLRSYGRKRGRTLSNARQEAFAALWPHYRLAPEDASGLVASPMICEIGFGSGEQLHAQASARPHIFFLGCEPYVNGLSAMLHLLQQEPIENLRLYDGDARLLLAALPDHRLAEIWVFFPDPWPKARHHKKRLIAQETLALFHQKLAPKGLLRLATDHTDYATWMLEQLLQCRLFRWHANSCRDWREPPPGWQRTRYQAKAEAEGRNPVFLTWESLYPSQMKN